MPVEENAMKYVVEKPKRVGVPVVGEEAKFPVRRVHCVGRNYASHAREMGSDPDKEPPFFFSKANDAESIIITPKNTTLLIFFLL